MNALLEITIGYGVTLTDAALALLREASVTELSVHKSGETTWVNPNPVVSAEALARLQELLGPKGEVGIKRVVSNSSTAALERFGQRNTTIENTLCHVAVAGLGLLTVNEVRHENDCCTHQLQLMLSDGWRILAVCVQPDQRRPDYILGRTAPAELPKRMRELDTPRPMPVPERPEPSSADDIPY